MPLQISRYKMTESNSTREREACGERACVRRLECGGEIFVEIWLNRNGDFAMGEMTPTTVAVVVLVFALAIEEEGEC